MPKLAAEGIGGVVNTCAETEGPVRAYPKYEIEQLHIPTVDFTPPALPDIEKAVAFIDRLHAQGKGVYVHCKAGRGRSATVALCWLVSARDWTPEAAQQHLLNRRPHVNKKLYLRDVVRVFYAKRRQTGSPARPA
ncbi:MAG: dual specificity protein phosphatase family protein [Planctomycetota bacterium]|nr:dual specificity protein phosphatase family protein [Planctomycetota bacterium]